MSQAVARRVLQVRRLGTVSYPEALAMQRALVEERRADRVGDLLLLFQHPPVITVGVKGDGGRSNVVATPERLAELGIAVEETGRGGDVTYHGPGQIVGYPIVDLRPDRQDVHRYVRDLEEVMIRTCADYGLEAGRIQGLTGAWSRRREDRRHRRPDLALDHQPRLRVQRLHAAGSLPADRAVRHRRPRRDVAREGDRPADRGGRSGGPDRRPLRERVRSGDPPVGLKTDRYDRRTAGARPYPPYSGNRSQRTPAYTTWKWSSCAS